MKKVLIGGLLAGAVILIMGVVFGGMSAEMYKLSPQVFWKPMGGDWFTKIAIFDFATGLLLAYVYSMIKGSIPVTGLVKGLVFGVMIWAVGPLLGLTMTYLTMAIRAKLIAVWAANNLINYILSGLIFEVIEEKIS